MNKLDFYVSLNLINILLCICMFGMFLIFFITCYIASNWLAPCCLIVLYIITKIFLLHILFINVEKFFPDSILSKMARELKTNINNRKFVLLLALCYDAVVALYFAFPLLLKSDFGSLLFFPILWEIYTLGGVCMFYISLFFIWKIQDKKISRTKWFIYKNAAALKRGKEVSGSLGFTSDSNLHNAFGKVNVLSAKLQGKYIEFILLDTYDFNPNEKNWKVQMGYSAQKAGLLHPYFTIVKCSSITNRLQPQLAPARTRYAGS